MEVENMMMMSSRINMSNYKEEEEAEDVDVELPGFRFHPTDEELVGFYLRRKVEKRPIRLELIKLVDIYKFDPWDLPIKSKGVGDKEWYFFCRRGRKYKNSVRPNRVTRSGFWKATGIDRPIYSSTRNDRECIGLKKSLVYYRGSAGKGTKTDWMMHEFRLPTAHEKTRTKHADVANPISQEAEVWTLCRILKRNASYRKCVPEWREMAAAAANNNINKRVQPNAANNPDVCSQSSSSSNYISFMRAPTPHHTQNIQTQTHHQLVVESSTADHEQHHQVLGHFNLMSSSSSSHDHQDQDKDVYGDINHFLRHADWEDLRSVVDCAAAANPSYSDHKYYSLS